MVESTTILAAWGEQATTQSAGLIDAVAAAVLHKLGEKIVSLTTTDLAEVHRLYEIQRNFDEVNGWTIRLVSRGSDDPKLPLEDGDHETRI